MATYPQNCTITLTAPGRECPKNSTGETFPSMTLCYTNACPDICTQALAFNAFNVSPSLRWKTPVQHKEFSGKIKEIKQGSRSLHLFVFAGIILALLILFSLFWGIRFIIRLPAHDRIPLLVLICIEVIAGTLLVLMLPTHDGDELINLQRAVLSLFTFGDLDMYVHPPLYFNLIAALQALWIAAGAQGKPLVDATIAAYLGDFQSLLIVARLISLIFGLGISVVTFLIARQMISRLESVIAALAAFSLSIFFATDLSPYTMSVFFSYAYIYMAVFSPEPMGNRRAFVTGLIGGLAISGVYLAAIILPLGLIGPWVRGNRLKWKQVIWAFTGVSVAIIATNPHLFDNFHGYARAFLYRVSELNTYDKRGLFVPGHILKDRSSFLYYLKYIAENDGSFVLAGIIYTAVKAFKYRNHKLIALMASLAWVILVLSVFPTRVNRYLMFAWPLLAIVAVTWVVPFADLLFSLTGLIYRVIRKKEVFKQVSWMSFGFQILFYLWLFSFFVPSHGWVIHPTLQQQSPITEVKDWFQKYTKPDEITGINSEEIVLFARAQEKNRISPELAKKAQVWFEHKVGRKVIYLRRMNVRPNKSHEPHAWNLTIEYNRLPGHACKGIRDIDGCKEINGFVMKWKHLNK